MSALNYDDIEIEVVPRAYVSYPPPEGFDGVMHPVECSLMMCEFWGDMAVEFGKPVEGECPLCGSPLQKDFSRHMWGIDSRGAGFNETKIGQRIKRDRIKKSERLAVSQWDNHRADQFIQNPDNVRNPTEGGPLDPNSKFNRHKKKNTKTIYTKGSE